MDAELEWARSVTQQLADASRASDTQAERLHKTWARIYRMDNELAGLRDEIRALSHRLGAVTLVMTDNLHSVKVPDDETGEYDYDPKVRG